jgi:hypothetical protein
MGFPVLPFCFWAVLAEGSPCSGEGSPCAAERAQYRRIATYFAPKTANICPLCEKCPAYPPGRAAASSDCGEKVPNLRLWRNAPGVPLPQPVLAVILRLGK